MPVFRPGKPYWLATLSDEQPQASGIQVVPYDLVDDDGEWGSSSTGGAVVIEIAGLYLATHHIRMTQDAAGSCFVHVNGARRSGNSGSRNSSCSVVMQLLDGDLVEAVTFFGTGRTLEVAGSGFELVRIGPVRWT